MPFRPRTSRSSYRKKTYKRRTSRFAKRRSAYRKKPNNTNRLTMRAPLASRQLRIKLPWVKTFGFVSSSVGFPAQSYSFYGSGIFPYSQQAQTTGVGIAPHLVTGDNLPSGIVEYSNLYNKYCIDGSSISVEAYTDVPSDTNPGQQIGVVLLAVPYDTTIGTPDSWDETRTQLDSYDYEQLLGWPYAKWKALGSNTGNYSRLKFKMFRKTKAMCGLKDLVDNDNYTGHLTNGKTEFLSSIDTGVYQYNPASGFMYYLRFFAQGQEDSSAYVRVTVRMMLYATMFSREFNPTTQITVIEDEPEP